MASEDDPMHGALCPQQLGGRVNDRGRESGHDLLDLTGSPFFRQMKRTKVESTINNNKIIGTIIS